MLARPQQARRQAGPEGERMKICVYAISKNEAHFVERFCNSASDADLVLIADTGSADGTAEVARAHGAIVHDICISPWRFDLARNAALALIPRDVDICISLDLDEVLEPGWRQEIERVWEAGKTTRLRYMFDWGCGIRFRYEKIHARHGYRWHHPCHEYPVPDGRITEVWADTDALLVSHHPDPTKSRGQYMSLLEVSVKEDPRCPRNAFYHARELTFHNRWAEAIAALEAYLKMPEANWLNERCYAMRLLGKANAETGRNGPAEKWYALAAAEAPNTREPWCELAMLMYRQARWEECFAYSMRALRIVDRQMVYTCDPAVWGHWAHDLAAIAAWNMGMKDIAREQAERALALSPDDVRLAANLHFMRGDQEEKAA
jgi:tetratricopeptide (TPR) repeat protein